ncbi:hypothetical protein Pyn_17875 [Prunus yedoensis var. nudiflora]|uniref:Uncharacterized protein n=1 Tax=Prunus yedoensis var. nudiflora TaxID=2094558 RepID=A0A314YUQ7_PRUYE|nr:hypothetical protein Pyn_17875 [Prunus yedoensis var. nudiflora]
MFAVSVTVRSVQFRVMGSVGHRHHRYCVPLRVFRSVCRIALRGCVTLFARPALKFEKYDLELNCGSHGRNGQMNLLQHS